MILAGHDGRRGFIHHTAVSSLHRKEGVGTKLSDEALRALKNEGITKVSLVAFKRNQLGNAFWEKHGFQVREDLNYRNKALVDLKRIDT